MRNEELINQARSVVDGFRAIQLALSEGLVKSTDVDVAGLLGAAPLIEELDGLLRKATEEDSPEAESAADDGQGREVPEEYGFLQDEQFQQQLAQLGSDRERITAAAEALYETLAEQLGDEQQADEAITTDLIDEMVGQMRQLGLIGGDAQGGEEDAGQAEEAVSGDPSGQPAGDGKPSETDQGPDGSNQDDAGETPPGEGLYDEAAQQGSVEAPGGADDGSQGEPDNIVPGDQPPADSAGQPGAVTVDQQAGVPIDPGQAMSAGPVDNSGPVSQALATIIRAVAAAIQG